MAEQRDFTTVKFDPVDKVGAHQFDMLLGFVKHIGIIDQDLTDVATQVVTDRPHNDITLLMNKERGMAMFCGVFDGFPMFEQYVEIPLQLFFGLTYTSSTDDKAHAIRHFEACQGLFELGTFVTFDAAGDTTGTGVVWHQDQIATSQADKGCQRSAFGAAFFLIDLDDNFLTFFDHFLDIGATGERITGREIFAGNLF